MLGLSTLSGRGVVTSPLQMPQLVTALQSTAAKSLSKHVYTCSRWQSFALVKGQFCRLAHDRFIGGRL